jgi:hypothetical protein
MKTEHCILREGPGFEWQGRVTPEIKFTPEFRAEHEGMEVPVEVDGKATYRGKLQFRGNELWLTDVAPAVLSPVTASQ